MYPAIKPGSTPKELLPELGHTPNIQGNFSSIVKQEIEVQKKLENLNLNDKKNN